MSVVSLVIQENLVNRVIQGILVDQENLALKDDLVKMVLMVTNVIVLSALEFLHKKENLVIQEHQENVGLPDL